MGIKAYFAFSSIFLILIPYGGEGYYKLSNMLIFVIQLVILLIIIKGFEITKKLKNLVLSFALLFCVQVFSNAYVAIVVGLDFSYADLSEFIRVFQLVLPIICLAGISSFNKKYAGVIILSIMLFSLIHALLMLIPKFTLALDNIVELFGEGHYYTAGYSRYRGFGIIGQPGKAGMFSVLCIMIALIHYHTFKSNKLSVILTIIFSFVAIGLTLSRISIILSVVVLFFLIESRKVKVSLIVMLVLCLFSFVLTNTQLVETLIRGIDLENGKYATASHRMVLKLWALDFISQRFDTLLIGVGDTKDYISKFTHPYAFDLSLRTPDSSQSVWLVRFGLIGVLVGYIPLVYIFICIMCSNQPLGKKLYISIVPILIFILSFLDPFYHDSKISITAAILYLYIFSFLENKESIHENSSSRP